MNISDMEWSQFITAWYLSQKELTKNYVGGHFG